MTAPAALMALALAGGLAPLALREYYPVARPGTRAVAHVPSIGSCFSGGLLIAAGFIHLLADAAEQLDGGAYPWAIFFCALGFIGVMLIERAARVCLAVRVGLRSPRTRTGALWRSGRNASQFPALVWCPAVAREDSDDVSRRRRRRWAAAPRCCETTLLG